MDTIDYISEEIAIEYMKSGLSVVAPAWKQKKPDASWTIYQKRLPTETELRIKFSPGYKRDGIGFVCGNVSGNLETLDFDCAGVDFNDWKSKVPPELFNKLVIEQTPSGGYHVYYRCEVISNNQKIAFNENGECTIETRGEGGFVKCSPSEGYRLVQGRIQDIQTITVDERCTLFNAAYSCDKTPPEPKKQTTEVPKKTKPIQGLSTIDDYNQRVSIDEVRKMLINIGWEFKRTCGNGNEEWVRPGKNPADGHSAHLKVVNGIPMLHNWSSNAGVKLGASSAFQLYAELNHHGDFSAAVKELSRQGYGERFAQKESDEAPSNGIISLNAGRSKEKIKIDFSKQKRINRREIETYTEFPLDALPLECCQYIHGVSASMNTDPGAVAMAFLTQVGATLGAAVRIKLGAQWRAVPIIWTGIIGISGMGKSNIIDVNNQLISGSQDKMNNVYAEEYEKYKALLKEYEKKIRRNEEATPPVRPLNRKLFITNATYEGLIQAVIDSDNRLLLCLDELMSLFDMMNQSKTPGEASKWLSGYNGGMVSTARKIAKELYAKKAYWAIVGGTTPETFRDTMTRTGGHKDGTLSRFCLVWAPDPRFQRVNNVGEIEARIEKVKRISELLAEYKPEGEFTELKMDEETSELWQQYREENYNERLQEDTDAMAALISKTQELIPKIAIILRCLDSAAAFVNRMNVADIPDDSLGFPSFRMPRQDEFKIADTIDINIWNRAKAIADWAVNETQCVYKMLNFVKEESVDSLSKKTLLKIRDAGVDGISERDLSRAIWNFKSKDGKVLMTKTLEALRDNGYIKKIAISPNGRIAVRWILEEDVDFDKIK